ncbi:MAG: hypothetical protein JWM11_2533 [Planctomycetaceae bacterium]|nr:hypothetical protein [Planctomycetaceae bacterium]
MVGGADRTPQVPWSLTTAAYGFVIAGLLGLIVVIWFPTTHHRNTELVNGRPENHVNETGSSRGNAQQSPSGGAAPGFYTPDSYGPTIPAFTPGDTVGTIPRINSPSFGPASHDKVAHLLIHFGNAEKAISHLKSIKTVSEETRAAAIFLSEWEKDFEGSTSAADNKPVVTAYLTSLKEKLETKALNLPVPGDRVLVETADGDAGETIRRKLHEAQHGLKVLNDKSKLERKLADDTFLLAQTCQKLKIDLAVNFLIVAGDRLNQTQDLEIQVEKKSREVENLKLEAEKLTAKSDQKLNWTTERWTILGQLLSSSAIAGILLGFVKPVADRWSNYLSSSKSDEPRIRVILEQLLKSAEPSIPEAKAKE